MVRGNLYNKDLIGETWSPTASMRTLKYIPEHAVKKKVRVNQLDFIGSFLQKNIKNRVFMKLNRRYADYFPEYSSCFGRALILLKSMY